METVMQHLVTLRKVNESDKSMGSKVFVMTILIGKPLLFLAILALVYFMRDRIRRYFTPRRRNARPDRSTDVSNSPDMVTPLPAVWPGLLAPLTLTKDHDGDMCPFCLDDLSTEKCASLPCSHSMHKDCFLTWFNKRRRAICPICLCDHTVWKSPPD